jgi:hypothetical protein
MDNPEAVPVIASISGVLVASDVLRHEATYDLPLRQETHNRANAWSVTFTK